MFKSLKIGLVFYQNNQYKTQKNTICYLTNKWLFQKKKNWGSICLPTYPKFISNILYNKCMDILLHVDNCHLFTQFLTCGNY